MKTWLFIFILLGMTYSQSENINYKTVTSVFKTNFNKSNDNDIFNQFADVLKHALPLENTLQFLSGIRNQAGMIKSMEFTNFNQTYAVYKTTFEKSVLDVYLSVDANMKINGIQVKPHIPKAKLLRNKSILQLPFNDNWTVLWGGDTKVDNYHVVSQTQKHAFDFLIFDEQGKSFANDGSKNEDYYAFNKKLFTPVEGTVVLVVDGVKDNIPGEMNPLFATGNTVIIKTIHDEYLVFAHFKQHSIIVNQDQKVKAGDLIGLVGNSGNSTETHIHFHIQDGEHLSNSVGVKAYFDKFVVNGKEKKDYSPVKGEVISKE